MENTLLRMHWLPLQSLNIWWLEFEISPIFGSASFHEWWCIENITRLLVRKLKSFVKRENPRPIPEKIFPISEAVARQHKEDRRELVAIFLPIHGQIFFFYKYTDISSSFFLQIVHRYLLFFTQTFSFMPKNIQMRNY